MLLYFSNIISRKKNRTKKLLVLKKVRKNNFQFKPFPAEVMMGSKCAIAEASLRTRPEVATTEYKKED